MPRGFPLQIKNGYDTVAICHIQRTGRKGGGMDKKEVDPYGEMRIR